MNRPERVHGTGAPYESAPGIWRHPLLCGGWGGRKSTDYPQLNPDNITCKKCLIKLKEIAAVASMTRECKKCGVLMKLSQWQVRFKCYLCPTCRTESRRKNYTKEYEAHKPWAREYQKRPDVKFRNRCRYRTREAIKKGLLVKKPCCICFSESVNAHHLSYTDHMNVVWLCRKHHRDVHDGKIVLEHANG